MKAFKVLKFFNLTDKSNNLSLTNIVVLALIIQMIDTPFSWPTAAALMLALINYIHKRKEMNDFIKRKEEAIDLFVLQNEVTQIKLSIQNYKEVQEQVAKQSEDVKKLLSQNNLAQAFKGRGQ